MTVVSADEGPMSARRDVVGGFQEFVREHQRTLFGFAVTLCGDRVRRRTSSPTCSATPARDGIASVLSTIPLPMSDAWC